MKRFLLAKVQMKGYIINLKIGKVMFRWEVIFYEKTFRNWDEKMLKYKPPLLIKNEEDKVIPPSSLNQGSLSLSLSSSSSLNSLQEHIKMSDAY